MLEKLLNSAVVDTDDQGLRQFIYEHSKVFAQFTADNCPICALVAPGFLKLADDKAYDSILFIRLDSDDNPVAKHLMAERAAPFFVSYCQGRMLECDTQVTDAAVLAQLDRLRAHQPHPA
ncbi:thioredoxin family protein [Hymenobacter sp. BT770]|uniref:thioredoxin family protein n=1 Tax=Hymenobacter sp. BT770 TaxID=2886942 RepID=UPI001D0F67DB|nr:thioredoxin family protein [Hymenobacter sp. BT770]MCC3152449.1 thioredoxin family protein [Hymenobacter sp. BT770]MDO3414575.1 thioredoxin family protein [Hymenobacter sp. BT770]